jgi:hypothetical protein
MSKIETVGLATASKDRMQDYVNVVITTSAYAPGKRPYSPVLDEQ